MEHVLVETLLHVRQYRCMLHFELPADIPTASQPEIQCRVQGIRPWLKPEGLLLQGTILEELSYLLDNGEREQREQVLHFTYLVPISDLREPNLLNFEVQPVIEQLHYHCVRKDRQVVIRQNLQLQLVLYEYGVQESASWRDTGLQKKSGLFLKHTGEVEESFLKIEQIQLPDDFSLLIKLSGRVHELKTERTDDGCMVDWVCHVQGEYVTREEKVGTFFFEKREYVFLPLPHASAVDAEQILARVTVSELALESDEEMMILYRCHLQTAEWCATHYYTVDPARLPEGAAARRMEVEQQSGRQVTASRMLEERADLVQLPVERITRISGECKEIHTEEVQGQLLVSGDLEFTAVYLGQDGLERTYGWVKHFDQMILCTEPGGGWQTEAQVQIADWAFCNGKLELSAVINFQSQYRSRGQEWVLIRVPTEWQGVERACFLVREEIAADQVTFTGEENVYLHRYAQRILQTQGQVTGWQVKVVDGGWMIKGQAELVIYYETGEGERHIGQPFRWYQFIPSAGPTHGAILQLRPGMQILDEELLEDGSLLRLRHLIRLSYVVCQEHEEELVTAMEAAFGRMRPVLQTGRVERQFIEQIGLEEGLLPVNRVKEIQEVQVEWRDYAVRMRDEELEVEGEVEVQIRYRNRFGRERVKRSSLPVRFVERIAAEGEPSQQVRAVPLIKGYDYRLTGHPPKENTMKLSISVELNYRLVGQISCF